MLKTDAWKPNLQPEPSLAQWDQSVVVLEEMNPPVPKSLDKYKVY